jgi:UDP-N-acetylglucosamine 2-epimerase (non-hydrolysing)/GDP/UDP-N,N'-diacetylbacillosamine 2-epimerase (hydrolysing)
LQSTPTSRRIAVVSSSRADFGHLFWVLKELQANPAIDLRIIATASHMAPGFGQTVEQFEAHGFKLEGQVESLLDSDSDIGMAKTIGVSILGLADLLGRLRPDLMLLIADRYEMLAPASTALALRIPMAHIEGGEISEGAIDDAVRNALTKMSHLHFVSTVDARRRVLALGEEAWRVHRAGAPSLDHLKRSTLPDRAHMESVLDLDLSTAPIVVAHHPVTLMRDATDEIDALFEVLEAQTAPVVFCYPNADAGHQPIIERARDFCRRHPTGRLNTNLDLFDFWGLLKLAEVMIGNSSSGIMETPSLALPFVNIGPRQKGRERALNAIDAAGTKDAILQGLARARSPEFRRSLDGMSNPYGDGDAARTIARVLATCPLGDALLVKRALPLNPIHPAFEHDATST